MVLIFVSVIAKKVCVALLGATAAVAVDFVIVVVDIVIAVGVVDFVLMFL